MENNEYPLSRWSRLFFKKYEINNQNNWFENNVSVDEFGIPKVDEIKKEKAMNNHLSVNILKCLDFLFLPFFTDGKLQYFYTDRIQKIEDIFKIVFHHLTGDHPDIDFLSHVKKMDFSVNRFKKSTDWYIIMKERYRDSEFEEFEQFRNLLCFFFVMISFLVDQSVTFREYTNCNADFLLIMAVVLDKPLKKWVVSNNLRDDNNYKMHFFAGKDEEFYHNKSRIDITDSYIDFLVAEEGEVLMDMESIMNIFCNVSGLYFKGISMTNFESFLNVLAIFHKTTLIYASEQFTTQNEKKINGLDYLQLTGLITDKTNKYYIMTPYIEIGPHQKMLVLLYNVIYKKEGIQLGENQTVELGSMKEIFNYDLVEEKSSNEEVELEISIEGDKVKIESEEEKQQFELNRFTPFLHTFRRKLVTRLQKSIIVGKEDSKIVDMWTYMLELSKWGDFFELENHVYFGKQELEEMHLIVDNWDKNRSKSETLRGILYDSVVDTNKEDPDSLKLLYYNENKEKVIVSNEFNLKEMLYGVVPLMVVFFKELKKDSKYDEKILEISGVFVDIMASIISASLIESEDDKFLLRSQDRVKEVINGAIKDSFPILYL